jgi:predicted MPP superfamily phosphohydrolase
MWNGSQLVAATGQRLLSIPTSFALRKECKNTMAKFILGFLSIWGALHLYVFWRLSSIPWISQHVSPLALTIAGAALWSSYVLARILDEKGLQAVSWPLEYLAANWIGLLFLLFWALLASDVVTLGGWLFHEHVSKIRGWAVIIACSLSVVALIQAIRPPVVADYEVQLAGLPPEQDGTVLLQLSDLHLGNLLGRRWLGSLISRVNQMKPDIVVIAGDLVDGNVGRVEPLREVLKGLHAPLGVWAVTGNHEFYAGLERSVRLLENAGFRVLRDRHEQIAPGLIIAGVDDLTARQQFGVDNHALEKAMVNRPPGATILLSHSPWQAEKAAAVGTGLMLSGHTHNGQVWPFNYLVRIRYPLLAGRYEVNGMTAIVCRGTGTWGPRMRLWRPSEMVRVKLKAGLHANP